MPPSMNSPIYLEWAARQPALKAPLSMPRDPRLALLASGLLVMATAVGWHELEPLISFRPAPAVVLSAGIATQERIPGTQGPAVNRLGAGTRDPLAEVDFRYEVDGRRYFGSQVSRVEPPAAGASTLAAYRPGTALTVWFNPWRPTEAVLSRTPHGPMLGTVAGLALIAILVLLATTGPTRAMRGVRLPKPPQPASPARSAPHRPAR